MSDMKAYLAAKYMSGPMADAILARSGDKKKRKKRPKNEDYVGGAAADEPAASGSGSGSGAGFMFHDEDEWASGSRRDQDDLEGEDAPVISTGRATFKKAKSAWATVGATSIPLSEGAEGEVKTELDADDDGEDDRGIKSEPETTIKSEPTSPPPPSKPLTKRRGGLRTAAQMAEEAAAEAAAKAEAAARSPSPPPDFDPTETVHRDRSGRVLDVEELRAQARREEEAERRKEAERKEWTKGFAQRAERIRMASEERRMAGADVARGADDYAMNREMKEQERWNDPAAAFVTKKKSKGPRYPTYKGGYPQNRFNIPPGYRWDGVDRSNGFEKKFFQSQNAHARRTLAANQWSMEDM